MKIELWIAVVAAVAAFGLGTLTCILLHRRKAKNDERKIANAEEEALRIINEAMDNGYSVDDTNIAIENLGAKPLIKA